MVALLHTHTHGWIYMQTDNCFICYLLGYILTKANGYVPCEVAEFFVARQWEELESVSQSESLCNCRSVCLSVCLSICLSVRPSVRLDVNPLQDS